MKDREQELAEMEKKVEEMNKEVEDLQAKYKKEQQEFDEWGTRVGYFERVRKLNRAYDEFCTAMHNRYRLRSDLTNARLRIKREKKSQQEGAGVD